MKPSFSFLYNGVPFSNLPCKVEEKENETIYILPDGLELTCKYEYFPEYGVSKWVNYWNNPTDRNSGVISELCDCDITIPMEYDEPISRRNRQLTWEPQTMQLYVTRGTFNNDDDHKIDLVKLFPGQNHTFKCVAGRSAMDTAPFFEIHRQNKGILAAIGWTGQWEARVDRGEHDVRVRFGLKDTVFHMHPGEHFRTVSATILEYECSRTDAHNIWRRYFKNEVSPMGRYKGERGTQCPFSAIFWGGVTSEALIRRWKDIDKAELPLDTCWIDAGWYEPLTYDTMTEQMANWGNVGDWTVSKYYHPDGYKDVTKYLHDTNKKFMIWFEPERLRRSVKCWTGFIEGDCVGSNDVLVDFGNDEVCDQVIEMVCKHIEDIGIDCYRQDCNIGPMPFWEGNDKIQPDASARKGVTQIRHINNLYRFWDAMLERFPNLLIDNCAGGGHRNDIEMLSRSVPLWRSDYQCLWDSCPEANQNHNARSAYWLPYTGIGFGPTLGDVYNFRSAYTNGMTVRTWEHADPEWEVGASGEPLEWAKKYFTEYNEIRHFFAEDFYPLIPPVQSNTTWCASQYHDRDKNEGIILAFRRAMCPFEDAKVELGGIDVTKTYTFKNRDTGEKTVISGAELEANGFKMNIPEKRQSLLLEYCAE